MDDRKCQEQTQYVNKHAQRQRAHPRTSTRYAKFSSDEKLPDYWVIKTPLRRESRPHAEYISPANGALAGHTKRDEKRKMEQLMTPKGGG